MRSAAWTRRRPPRTRRVGGSPAGPCWWSPPARPPAGGAGGGPGRRRRGRWRPPWPSARPGRRRPGPGSPWRRAWRPAAPWAQGCAWSGPTTSSRRGAKVGGLLTEAAGGVVAVGLGVNLYWPQPTVAGAGALCDAGPRAGGGAAAGRRPGPQDLLARVAAGPERLGAWRVRRLLRHPGAGGHLGAGRAGPGGGGGRRTAAWRWRPPPGAGCCTPARSTRCAPSDGAPRRAV